MHESGFRDFMGVRGAGEIEVEHALALADRFEEFCRAEAGVSASEATIELATAFSALLGESADPVHGLRALSGYARFLGSKAACVVFQGALAGQRAFGGVRKKVEVELGEHECDELLAGILTPPLGASGLERAHAMHLLVDRLELALGREKAAALIA